MWMRCCCRCCCYIIFFISHQFFLFIYLFIQCLIFINTTNEETNNVWFNRPMRIAMSVCILYSIRDTKEKESECELGCSFVWVSYCHSKQIYTMKMNAKDEEGETLHARTLIIVNAEKVKSQIGRAIIILRRGMNKKKHFMYTDTRVHRKQNDVVVVFIIILALVWVR